MTETKTAKKATIKEVELKPQVNLSPSSINAYIKCPRCYFYNYIAKLKQPKSIHLVKGSIVHEVLEYFFKGYKKGLKDNMFALFDKAWKKYDKALKDLELAPEILEQERIDAYNILHEYWISFERQMTSLMEAGKAENESHAYYLLKPKFRELYVKDERLHCVGYIDRVHQDFDGYITVADYKTSKRYGMGFPMDYVRQLAIYALLYKNQTGEMPDFAAVNFLRYGETDRIMVTPQILEFARMTIEDIYSKTRTINIEDYPPTAGSSKWCAYADLHDGTDEWKQRLRLQKFQEKIKEEEDKEDESVRIEETKD